MVRADVLGSRPELEIVHLHVIRCRDTRGRRRLSESPAVLRTPRLLFSQRANAMSKTLSLTKIFALGLISMMTITGCGNNENNEDEDPTITLVKEMGEDSSKDQVDMGGDDPDASRPGEGEDIDGDGIDDGDRR